MKRFLLPVVIVLLSSCAPHLYDSMPSYMASKKLIEPTTKLFPHCQNYGCAVVKNVELNKRDWKQIDKEFGKKAKNAQAEREKIAKTIGVFEKIVGPITKTENDKPGTFEQTGPGQLDCVDESTNTTVYMMLLNQKGLLKFHTIEQPQVRYPLISGRGWMHQTAVVRETKTGAEYAIDSWFDENGDTARIVPIADWLKGWHPVAAKGE
jgi:hypothetical protein